MKTRFLIIIIVAISIPLAVLAYDSISLDKLCHDDGGKRIGDNCLIPIVANSTNTQIVDISQIKTMKPNSMKYFYYPNTKNSEKADPYQTFMLIRLPEWMGGDANDSTAFRAYSAKSLDDSCLVKYWGDYGRERIENPCQGAMYRVVDGTMTFGATHRSTAMTALPHLDLANDENGFLYALPPKWEKTENGVVGYGREMTLDEIHNGSAFVAKSFEKSFPDYPPIPIEFAGHVLSEISPDNYGAIISYLDFPSKSGSISMTVSKTYLGFNTRDLTQPNSEFWQIGNNIIKIGGSALEKNTDRPESLRSYMIEFNNGINFRIEGKNLEFMKQETVKNFFPEYKYEDMFLITKTTE